MSIVIDQLWNDFGQSLRSIQKVEGRSESSVYIDFYNTKLLLSGVKEKIL